MKAFVWEIEPFISNHTFDTKKIGFEQRASQTWLQIFYIYIYIYLWTYNIDLSIFFQEADREMNTSIVLQDIRGLK